MGGVSPSPIKALGNGQGVIEPVLLFECESQAEKQIAISRVFPKIGSVDYLGLVWATVVEKHDPQETSHREIPIGRLIVAQTIFEPHGAFEMCQSFQGIALGTHPLFGRRFDMISQAKLQHGSEKTRNMTLV
jgi:hypothetical protein